MIFYIAPIVEGKLTRLKVKRVFESEVFERYEVIGKNKTLVLQTNRPVFVHKGLKHRKGQWKLLSGNLSKRSAFERITEALNKALE